MKSIEELEPGKFYHIYNCGINGEDIFRAKEDYERFIRSYERFILPVCETFCWVLMKNHFHFFVRIRSNIEYKYSKSDFMDDEEKFKELKWETVNVNHLNTTRINLEAAQNKKACQPLAYKHFSHLFNSYAKYFNIKYKRHGSLFERQFKRKCVDNRKYFQNLVIYIHQNPVHHGFCNHPVEYGWSSYLTCISLKPTAINRDIVIGWFDNLATFKNIHNKAISRKELDEYLGL